MYDLDFDTARRKVSNFENPKKAIKLIFLVLNYHNDYELSNLKKGQNIYTK